ncbi:hypothetical protein QOL99_14595 [Deinococcus sp. MIMF12]|uniref:Uncharacterized protein n=1 Tax=Deinococcus rhizophilus TaxID=3049544 RepID=A0ABT7JN79_9DEIO|nr:hypothetical protein [Deinococcus rhizophilus]MDL2345368.1 hypothetical protein [Deinococcus rhizophilus]
MSVKPLLARSPPMEAQGHAILVGADQHPERLGGEQVLEMAKQEFRGCKAHPEVREGAVPGLNVKVDMVDQTLDGRLVPGGSNLERSVIRRDGGQDEAPIAASHDR